MMKYMFSVCFFMGLLKFSSSNSFIILLVSLEMMTLGVYFVMLSSSWAFLNVHFFTSLLVFSVVEGVLGVSVMVGLFSNSVSLAKGVWTTKL